MLVVLALLAISGCDLFDSGLTYSGVVVDASTGAPVEGVHVSLHASGGGFGGYFVAEAVLTNSNGEFRLQTERQDTDLYVNRPEYDYGDNALYRPEYTSPGPIFYRDRDNIRIELQPRTPL